MNQKGTKLLSFSVTLLLLLQMKFFYLIPVEQFYNINGNQQQILMIIVVLVTLLLMGFQPIVGLKPNHFSIGIFIFLIYYLGMLIYSAEKNGQGLVNAFAASNFYLMILGYYIFGYYLKVKGVRKLDNIIIVVSFINVLVCWLQFILAQHGVLIMKMSTDTMRFGSVRISDMSETITCFGILLAFTRYFFTKGLNRNKILYLIMIILGVLGNLLVSKVRGTLIALLLGIITIVFFRYKNKPLHSIVALILMAICIPAFFKTSLGQTYKNSFSSAETDTVSIRQREYTYYNSQTESSYSNLIFGVGFIRDNGDGMSEYLRGPAHVYSRTDIGILGIVNAIGIIGALWYLIMLIKSGIYIFGSVNVTRNLASIAFASFFIFQIAYLPTMATLNPFSITSFVILLSAANYLMGESRYVKY